jgi:hypothetical protein
MQPRITSGPLTGRGPGGTWYLMKHVVADDHAAPIISGPLQADTQNLLYG